jgi:hypothetical protein
LCRHPFTPLAQMLMQSDFIDNYNHRHTWAMLPNADEFVVLKHVRVAFPGAPCARSCAR